MQIVRCLESGANFLLHSHMHAHTRSAHYDTDSMFAGHPRSSGTWEIPRKSFPSLFNLLHQLCALVRIQTAHEKLLRTSYLLHFLQDIVFLCVYSICFDIYSGTKSVGDVSFSQG